MTQVTVLTAVRNGAPFLQATLDSIRAQTFTDWEYLVVDDASTDDTAACVKAAAALDPRIRLVRRPVSGGPFVAANQGLRMARSRYVVRTDADDVSVPTRIATQLAFLRDHPGLRACGSDARMLEATEPGWRMPRTPGQLAWFLAYGCVLHHSSACFDREAFLSIGGYRELPVAQDYRLWCDLSRRGWAGVVPEVLVHFRRHADSITISRRAEQRAASVDILGDHLRALTGQAWDRAELEAMYAVARELHWPLRPALRALHRLEQAWRSDPALAEEDRTALAEETLERKSRFLQANVRTQPLALVPYLVARLAGPHRQAW